MDNIDTLTPKILFDEFRKIENDIGMKAIDEFRKLSSEEKLAFLEPTKQFVHTESVDQIRSWGITLLGLIGGEDAFQFLADFLQGATTRQKQTNRYSRFYALVGIERLATSEKQHNELQAIIDKVANDKDEQGLIWAGAKILLARQGRHEDEVELAAILKDSKNYWSCIANLRALRELPLVKLTDEIISIMRDSTYLDIKFHATRALGVSDYRENVKVIRALGEVVVTETSRFLRLEAVKALGRLQNRAAQSDVIHALQDEDAEIRVQAAKALASFLSKKEMVPILVQLALEGEAKETSLVYLIEAIRRVDPERTLTTEILSKELTNQDRKRAQDAERILLELGGWAAVQRLSQLRNTLEYLDKLLAESEQVVKSTFEGTIRQARFNFYFAMGVNILVVLVGLVLIILAIIQLIQHPEKLEAWIIPGGAGLMGVLINLAFNNPRRNAREDLSTLMNVNIVFLGFLRQLNEIDATFKHAYIEDNEFGVPEMRETVQQIDATVTQALRNVITNFGSSQER